jgi:hypothetical protein
MVAGADSIDDLNVVRHGGMATMFAGVYAPSTTSQARCGAYTPVVPTFSSFGGDFASFYL